MNASEISRQLSIKTEHPLRYDVISADQSLVVDDKNDDEQNPHFDVKLLVEAETETGLQLDKSAGKFVLSSALSGTGLLMYDYEGMKLTVLPTQNQAGICRCNTDMTVSFLPASGTRAALACEAEDLKWQPIETCEQE